MSDCVAVFVPNWVGDAVMATPAIRALRERFQSAKLLGVMRPYVADVFCGSPWFDAIIAHDPRGGGRLSDTAVSLRLRRERTGLAVLLPNSFRSALVAWLGGCTRRIGYDRYARRWLLTDALSPGRDSDGRLSPSPVLDAYNRLARAAGAEPTKRMELFTTPADEAAADNVWKLIAGAGPVVALNPGAAFGAAKHWPSESFAELARRLADERGCRVLVLCGPKERDIARGIVAAAGRREVVGLHDTALSLGLTKAVVRRCDLLVTTDSGPRHFAAAFGRPVVTLFGPTHIAWTETYHPAAIHLQVPVDCGPCQRRVCPLGHHRCMTELTPRTVFAAAERLLNREVRRAG